MSKTMSLQQIEANRRNALKSTGPQTPEGKAAVSLNALKHGLFARQVVVRGHNLKESREEFESFYRQYYEHLAPVGPPGGNARRANYRLPLAPASRPRG